MAAAAISRLLGPCRARQQLAVSVATCLLLLTLLLTRPTPAPAPTPAPTPTPQLDSGPHRDSGRLAGQLISDLWSADRPEHAWFTGAECRPLVTRFTRDLCLPLVYLASFPRSGNTWIRYLLEASTGLFTNGGVGPLYNSQVKYRPIEDKDLWRATNNSVNELIKMGYLGSNVPWTQGVTIISKTHFRPEPWTKEEAETISATGKLSVFPEGTKRRAVLVIRDPFKSFISLQKYSASGSILNPEDRRELFQGKEWHQFAMSYAPVWYKLNERWITSTDELHVVAYERLTRSTIEELTSTLRFLHVQPDPRRLECLRDQLEGKAHNRRHGVVPDHQTYPLLARAEIWKHIHQLNWLLKERGFPALPLERYSFFEEFGDAAVEA